MTSIFVVVNQTTLVTCSQAWQLTTTLRDYEFPTRTTTKQIHLRIYTGFSDSNDCTCSLIIDDESCIVGGTFQEIYYFSSIPTPEASFEYEVTNGTCDYVSGAMEFTKWYFPFNYQYKVFGQIAYKQDFTVSSDDGTVSNEMEDQIWFKGKWQRVPNTRGGDLEMQLTNKSVVLEHAIKPGKYVFFGLSSMRVLHGNGFENIRTIVRVELMEHGIVKGLICKCNATEYIEDMKNEELPDKEEINESYEITDGEWHHFGKIVLVYDEGNGLNLELSGFFNGKFYIGEWHPNTEEYLTKNLVKRQRERKLRRSSTVLSAYSKCSDLSNDDNNNGNEQDDGKIAASKMRNFYDQRSIHRLGHFEFKRIVEGQDGNNKDENGNGIGSNGGTNRMIMQNVEHDVVSVDMRGDVVIGRQRSLDSDDGDEEDHDRIEVKYPEDDFEDDERFVPDIQTADDDNFFDDQW